MKRLRRTRLDMLLCVLLLAACSRGSTPTETKLATPKADTPTAGICAEPGPLQWVVFTLNPDMPDPRCRKVRPDQRLKVINNTDAPVRLRIAHFDVEVEAGTEFEFPGAVGTYLAPGVHELMTSLHGGGGPEVWLITK